MSQRFEWTRVMHELKRRRLTVVRSELVAPRMQRITLGGAELEGFTSAAPGDHVKVFFPDPEVGEIVTPTIVNGRPQPPEGPGQVIVRDYTPLAFRPEAMGGPELVIDFVLHGEIGEGSEAGASHEASGPAAAWAAHAKPGDELVIAGPRGSRVPPTDIGGAILVADESALPAVARWLEHLGDTPALALLSVAEEGTSAYLAGYESPQRELRWFAGADRDARVAEALRGADIGEDTILFLAGEASSLIPLRRYLRRELGLPKEQVDIHGYWKRGIVALDHHAPLDATDPED